MKFPRLDLLKIVLINPKVKPIPVQWETKMEWKREPFYGGCRYYGEGNLFVIGYYSPADPLEFEPDCKSWLASNFPGEEFPSAEEAMAAAEHVFRVEQSINSTFFA
jgi:hypothetical protein